MFPFLILLGLQQILSLAPSGSSSPNSRSFEPPPSVTVSLATPYYYATESQHEWRVGIQLTGPHGDKFIECIRWESDFNGPWQTIPAPAGGRKIITPDALLDDEFNVRVHVNWDLGHGTIETTSNTLHLSAESINGIWPGINYGPVFEICDE